MRKVKMKGINIPRIFYSCAGWIDKKRHLIVKKDGIPYSPFLDCKQHDFETYSSAVYRITSENLKNLYIKRCDIRECLLDVRQKLKNNEIKLQCEMPAPDTVSGRRYEANLHMENEQLHDKCMEIVKSLNEIKVTIENAEFAMQEMLHGTKAKAEANLVAYLKGAGVSEESVVLLNEDTIAKNLYYEHCNFDYMTDRIFDEVAEKEGDMNETVR